MPHLIRGSLKDYDWGVVDGLVPWLGEATGEPQAELWFGVHPSGPAHLVRPGTGSPSANGGASTLAEVLSPEEAPLLVKILAAARPLSVQVHPDAELAAAAFAAQGEPGAPQVYADPYEKTELLIALTPFTAFAGWRPIDDAVQLLERVVGAEAATSALRSGDRVGALRALLAISDLEAALASLASVMSEHRDATVFDDVLVNFPADRGLLILPLLEPHRLAPGDAVYVPAGVPHSYVRGIGVEVMTSSDNVVRLGLTNKAIFVEHALDALSDTVQPSVIRRQASWIAPPGAPFAVRFASGNEEIRVEAGVYRVLLTLQGRSDVRVDDASWPVVAGQALAVLADEPDAVVCAVGTASTAVIVKSVPEGKRAT